MIRNACFILLTAGFLPAQEGADSAAVLYARYEGQGTSAKSWLQREDREGKDLGTVPMKDGDLVQRLRATPQATALAAFTTGVVEVDRSGKVVWEFRPAQAWDHAGEARRLAGGNTLI